MSYDNFLSICVNICCGAQKNCLIDSSFEYPQHVFFLIEKVVNECEPTHDNSNNVVCATSKASDQPVHTRSLIRAIASRLNILRVLSY